MTLLALYAQWQYATRRGRLVDSDFDRSVAHYTTRKILWSILVCFFCIGLSFFRPLISLVIFTLMPVVTMWPDRVDRHLQDEGKEESSRER